jgi:hypothetical protein
MPADSSLDTPHSGTPAPAPRWTAIDPTSPDLESSAPPSYDENPAMTLLSLAVVLPIVLAGMANIVFEMTHAPAVALPAAALGIAVACLGFLICRDNLASLRAARRAARSLPDERNTPGPAAPPQV